MPVGASLRAWRGRVPRPGAWRARSDAAKHRAAFRDALGSFLDLVVISLASGAGVDQALDEAASVGSGPAYAELRYALAEARLARVPPWDILAALGRRVAVPELQQLAATVGLAGTEGAKVRASLRSRAVALRERQLNDAEGERQRRHRTHGPPHRRPVRRLPDLPRLPSPRRRPRRPLNRPWVQQCHPQPSTSKEDLDMIDRTLIFTIFGGLLLAIIGGILYSLMA